MRDRIPVSVYVGTALLVLYTILIYLDAPIQITGLLFFISPFILTWIVVSILKSSYQNKNKLADGEEWGYEDKKKEEL